MSIIAVSSRSWNGTPISRRRSDGYVNATAMAKANGKEWAAYFRTDRATTYMEALSRNCKIAVTSLYISKPGEGTWIHPRLAVEFARWISADFAVWMDEFIHDCFPDLKSKLLPSQLELKRLFDYFSDTGQLIRKVSFSNKHVRGSIAGTVNNNGYVKVFVSGSYYYASRVIWKWVTGEDPAGMFIDHMNGDRSDNRWINLRKVDAKKNSWNSRDWSSKRSKLPRGVAVCGSRYKATIMKDRKRIHLGVFDTPELAHKAYADAKASMHGEYAGNYAPPSIHP